MAKPEKIHRPAEDQALARVGKSWDENPPQQKVELDIVVFDKIPARVNKIYAQMRLSGESQARFHTEGHLSFEQIQILRKRIERSFQIYNVYFSHIIVDDREITQITVHRN